MNGSSAVGAIPQTATGSGGGHNPPRLAVGDGDDPNSFNVGDHVQVVSTDLREWLGLTGKIIKIVEPADGFGTRWYVVDNEDLSHAVHFQASELKLLARVVEVAKPELTIVPEWLTEVPLEIQEEWLALLESKGYQEAPQREAEAPLTVADVLGDEAYEPPAWEVELIDVGMKFLDGLISVINLYATEDWGACDCDDEDSE